MQHKTSRIPENIYLLGILAYAPELNPAEKVWQYMKDTIAMKFNDTIEELQNRITSLIKTMDKELIKSITGYINYIQNTLLSNFK